MLSPYRPVVGKTGAMPEMPATHYATDRNLVARQRFWANSRREPVLDLFTWVLDLAGLHTDGVESVLDVGCGNGAYEKVLTERGHRGSWFALDLSAGMFTHISGAAGVQADVQALPFAAERFDVVLAPHMLYHVTDITAAAREIRRVLRRDGTLVAVTNGVSNLIEMRTLVETAVGTGWQMIRPADQHFSLENGAAILGTAFDSVTRVDCPTSHLIVTDIDALVGYVSSTADFYQPEVDTPWTDVVDRVRELATSAMSARGELHFTNSVGAFYCR